MGIENPTTRQAENSESNTERSERDIQSELSAVNAQIEVTPQEDKDSASMETLERAVNASREAHGLDKWEYEARSSEEIERIGKLQELTQKRNELETERNEFYKSNPGALKLRVKELYKNNLRDYLNANPEVKEEFMLGREMAPGTGYRHAFDAKQWFVRPQEDSKDIREYNALQEIQDHELWNEAEGRVYDRESSDAFTDFVYTQAAQELHDELTGKNQQQTPSAPAQGFQERVSPKTAEFMTNHIIDKDFGYQDADLPEEQKEQMLAWSRSSESAKKYAESIANAANSGGLENVRNIARQMRGTMLSEASRLGIPVSPYGKSMTWAMWDTGKQYHFFTHQNENDSRYEVGNPLESEAKREEIINRQLGWEAYAAFKHIPQYQERVLGGSMSEAALTLFNKAPKENGSLSSKDLAELGKLLRA